jgi:hypothetical protein
MAPYRRPLDNLGLQNEVKLAYDSPEFQAIGRKIGCASAMREVSRGIAA